MEPQWIQGHPFMDKGQFHIINVMCFLFPLVIIALEQKLKFVVFYSITNF